MARLHLIVVLGAIVLFVLTVACCEAGYRIGRLASEQPPSSHKGIGAIEAAIFGLFGLLLAFSFAAGLQNLVTRRDLIVAEANAIGTAYLRLDLLAAKDQPQVRKLFREYLDGRLRVYERLPDLSAAEQEFAGLAEVRNRIWSAVVSSTRAEASPAAPILLLPAINSMFDIATSRKVALYVHVPPLILTLLLSLAVLCALLAGYAMAERGRRSLLHMVIYALVTSITIYTVYDLDHPRGGFIRTDVADAELAGLRDLMR